ncbi:MAG: T9SS type A sorting domain-containing protein, partial [Bacteroidota bacterium]
IRYSPSGVEQCVQRYTENDYDWASSIAVDGSGNVYVTGRSSGSGTSEDYATIKYSQLTGITPISNQIPEASRLYQNYPNPFNPTTTISFSLPFRSFVSLKVFNALGEEVSVLLSEVLPAGTYSQQWNPEGLSTGVYFYRLQGDNFVDTKKLLLLR